MATPLTALTTLAGYLKAKGAIDHISAFVGGIVDGILIDKAPLIFLLKNIAVPVAGVFTKIIPDGLKYESEGMLGMLLYILLAGGKK